MLFIREIVVDEGRNTATNELRPIGIEEDLNSHELVVVVVVIVGLSSRSYQSYHSCGSISYPAYGPSAAGWQRGKRNARRHARLKR